MERARRGASDLVSRGGRHELLVFACAWAARLLYFLFARPDIASEHWGLAGDFLTYWQPGRASPHPYVPTTQYDPLYPAFLALARFVVGDREAVVQLIQLTVLSSSAPLLYALTYTLTHRRRAALVAGLGLALYPLAIRHAADGQNVALLGVLLLAFCVKFARATTVAGATMAGMWLGLAVLTRSMALPIVALGSAAWAVQGRARMAASLAASALVVWAPFAIRNYGLNGALLPARAGVNLYVATSEYTSGLLPEHHPDVVLTHLFRLLAERGVPVDGSPFIERRADLAMRSLAWENVARHPLEQLRLRVSFVSYFFSPFLVPARAGLPREEDVHFEPGGRVRIANDGPRRPWWIRAVYTATYTPVLVLAFVGMVRRRGCVRADAALWCVLATFAATHAVFAPTTFYRTSMEFVLLFYAAVALDRNTEERRPAPRKSLAAP